MKVVEPYVLSASFVRDSTKRDQRCGRGPIRIHKVQVSREGADPLWGPPRISVTVYLSVTAWTVPPVRALYVRRWDT